MNLISKSISIISIFLVLNACSHKTVSHQFYGQQLEFINTQILPGKIIQPHEEVLVLTINTTFCGSCTQRVLDFYHESFFDGYQKIFIPDAEEGKFIEEIRTLPNATMQYISLNDQEKGNFFSTYNRIYMIQDGTLIYANNVNDNTLKEISHYFKKMDSDH